MFANLDRENFIELLNKLGSENDADALSAARDLHAKVTVSGLGWDALLAPDVDEEDDGADAVSSPSGDDDAVLVAPDADLNPIDEAERAEAQALIAAIGAMKISETTRDELKQYKQDLADNAFEKMDLRYLRALNKRLTG